MIWIAIAYVAGILTGVLVLGFFALRSYNRDQARRANVNVEIIRAGSRFRPHKN